MAEKLLSSGDGVFTETNDSSKRRPALFGPLGLLSPVTDVVLRFTMAPGMTFAIHICGIDAIKARFRENSWSNNWRCTGICKYAHSRSTSHECLGCSQRWMELSLSVEGWTRLKLGVGDVIVVPAGVSHEMVDCSEDILMVRGYPDGRDWDNIQEKFLTEGLFRQAVKRIMMLPVPPWDPVTGEAPQRWLDAPSSVDGRWNDFRDGLDATSQRGRAPCVDGESIAHCGGFRALPAPRRA